ncbi:MAG TPA: isoprenylcysteine carboxylmethyltransferase family protein [Nitrospiria bacterium]
MLGKSKDTPGTIPPPPLIYGGTFLFGYLFHWVYPIRFSPGPLSSLIGWSLVIFSGLLVFLGIWAIKRGGTHVDPYKPTTVLVVDGPYRFTRNPLYLSLTLLYMGIAILLNLVWAALVLPVALIIMHFGVIAREEKYLERKFGQGYLQYKTRVRRWI